jgi:K+-sensing histidine kinase KdpD
LRRCQERLTQANTELTAAKKELETANAALRVTKEQLQKALTVIRSSDQARENLVRRINRSLQKPLNAMLGCVDILLHRVSDTIDEEHLEKIRNYIHNHASSFLNFTTNMLDISLINIAQAIKESTNVIAGEAQKNDITMMLNMPKNIHNLYGDDLRFRQIIIGLLSHALRNVVSGGKIIMQVQEIQRTEKKLHIAIIDDGVGIALDEMSKNSQALIEISRKSDGTDLSLIDIEKLILLHHGTLDIQAIRTKGTIIFVEFPYLSRSILESDEWVIADTAKASGMHKNSEKNNIVPFKKKDK